ncbi:helix-turn-helix transcriptional regulator [Stackebrandtia nassauensis]|uniref:Transcriptional regulator, AraC family n=1 Tax=Stackebrandtia nassauensis (strain DSM 44728 / CIP 108903 / NRRL B-16338 / NBRC 102104 / LLR-40K-21) TaxID=446470 RepID=D3PV53_STANL|nr:AraC family transcriptional regulator [Stackebrandtia nassauensis]ADD41106.1 transcriptional regulator, AraC family [Stackebrandtia nassauensis DSM 44728]
MATGRGYPGTAAIETLVAMRRARDLIDGHYSRPLDLDAMAAAAGYSRFYFVRAFRAAYGTTPSRYLSRRRVERAQELLRVANLTVTEVCYLVGFASLGSFSSRFTELVGVSPSEFQRRAHRAGPPPIPGCFLLMSAGPMPADAAKSAIQEKPSPSATP